ncbi:MAG: hypothetical protein R3208_02330 [Ketobacteraceae bacterium]|nr:hypothetical protein [Ketobacteraceae bacterium]
MNIAHSVRRLLLVSVLLSLAGCKTATESGPAYSLAQACVAMKAHDSNRYVVARNGSYQLAEVDESEAEKFYIRPADLGIFMLYDRDRNFFALDILSLKALVDPSHRVEWTINHVEVKKGNTKIADTYTLVSAQDNLRLSHKNNRFFFPKADIASVTTQRSAFDLIPQDPEQCTAFPEDDVDAEVSEAFYRVGNPTDKVKGYADIHAHLSMPKAMGSVVMAGDIFHRYGIEHALKDCEHIHGKEGALDILGMQRAGDVRHKTSGYPDFEHWPNIDNVSHVTAYYRWIERAYLAGLRLMVTHASGNPQFCQLMSMVHFGKSEGDCTPADTVRRQTEYIYKLQDYIDAQAGGPGKGWFRVATSSQQAREIINDNKLAVVLGSEYSTLFDCSSSNESCDEAFIDQELDKLYDMGIRSVFPIHRFDNAFGGAQYNGITWMHISSKLDTGHVDHLTDLVNPWKLLFKPIGGNFFDMEKCPEGIQGDKEVPSMREFIENDFTFITNALRNVPRVGGFLGTSLDFILLDKLEPIPDYAHLKDSTSSCNARSLQRMGKHLVNRIMDKGMLLEVDHMSYNTLQETFRLVEARGYPGIVSSHGILRDADRILERIYQLGGIGRTGGEPSQVNENIQATRGMIENTGNELGLGIGPDVQGIIFFGFGDEGFVPEYPFKSYDGTVTFTEPVIGNRTIDFEKEGIAHYGLFAEWVENFRQVSEAQGNDSFEIFMNSAEAYLQMWGRAEAAAIE